MLKMSGLLKMAVAVTLLVMGGAFSQITQGGDVEVTVGTGTGTWVYPLNTQYHDARTQTIYLASEIGATGAIKSLALDITSKPSQVMNNFTIRMKHTDLSNYSSSGQWEAQGWTVVYQVNQTITTTGWTVFPFSAVFDYNGQQNLMVDISFNNSYYTSSSYCRYSTPGGTRSLTYRTNSGNGDPLSWSGASPTPSLSNYLPNIKLVMTGDFPVVPNLAGLTLSEAQTALTSSNLVAGNITYDYSHTIAKDLIISQSPLAGQSVVKGSAVNLVISLGHPYYGGTGTEADPYQIATVANWTTLINNPSHGDKYFILAADIDFGGAEITPVAPDTRADISEFQGTKFTGTLNGQGHILKNFVINQPDRDYVGLFGYIGSGGLVHNLILENGIITGGYYVGGLCGYQSGSFAKIENCYATGAVMGNDSYVGGLCGMNNDGIQTNCYTTGAVTGGAYVGGLCGFNIGTLTNCYATGAVTGSAYVGGLCGSNSGPLNNCYATGIVSGNEPVGGLCGSNSGALTNCYANGAVMGNQNYGGLCGSNGGPLMNCYANGTVTGSGDNVGGLCGSNGGSLTNCYTTGAVMGNGTFVGGLCGWNTAGTLTNCYATGAVTGYRSHVGGLCGEIYSGTLSSCFATGTVTGSGDCVGGLCGWNKDGTLANCYATGAVTGRGSVGGLCGSHGGTLTNCYATGMVTGSDYVGGLCGGYNCGIIANCYFYVYGGPNNGRGIPLNDEQLQDQSQFAGFEFTGSCDDGMVDKWKIETGYMPRLSWQGSPGFRPPYLLDTLVTSLSGQGYPDDPFIIADQEDLMEFHANNILRRGYYCLTTDIDLAGIVYTEAVIPEVFFGHLEGNGHTISHLTINGGIGLGFFSKLSGSVRGLTLIDVQITGKGYNVGGLCGWNDYGTISSCYATGVVAGSSDFVGGLCGRNVYGILMNCYATGSVTGSSYFVGGLCGMNENGIITGCYTTDTVIGNSSVGGLCGMNENGIITGCYATGTVIGNSYVGGLCGYQIGSSAKIEYSFWDTITTDRTTGYNLKSSAPGTINNVIGKTTAEMQTLSTFINAGWDFSDSDGDAVDWKLVRPGEDYPRLAWQEEISGDVAGLWGVDSVDLAAMAAEWQSDSPARGDVNGDGTVDLMDFAAISENWLKS